MLGVLSTVGSQMSLFAMTALSITRLLVIRSARCRPAKINKRTAALVLTIVTVIIAMSLVIALTPLHPLQEDSFISGLYYKDVPMFVGSHDHHSHMDVIDAYYGRILRTNRGRSVILSWKEIRHLIGGMFTTNFGVLTGRDHHFYGSNGVCMFKFFVEQGDPEAVFTWITLMLNMLCFIIIVICYSTIFVKTSRMSPNKKCRANNLVRRRNNRLQRKIAVIIATDFCCWVPFIITNIFHFFGLVSGSSYYAVFSILIIPINSVINPLLFDDTITDMFDQLFSKVARQVGLAPGLCTRGPSQRSDFSARHYGFVGTLSTRTNTRTSIRTTNETAVTSM